MPGFETRSAGTARDAETRLTAGLIAWADVILVMEPHQRATMTREFPRAVCGKRVVCLAIPDDYEYMDEGLVRLLWERVPRSVPGLPARPD